MTQELHQIERRTTGYWYVDGLTEITVAGIFLLLALYFLIWHFITPGWISALSVGIGQPIIILLGYILGGKFVRLMKEKITYPRTGYVAYKQQEQLHRWQTIMLSSLIAGVIILVLMINRPDMTEGSLWLLTGISIAIFLSFMAIKASVTRYFLLAILMIVDGFVISIFHLTGPLAATYFYGIIALILFSSGAVTLGVYLQSNQDIAE